MAASKAVGGVYPVVTVIIARMFCHLMKYHLQVIQSGKAVTPVPFHSEESDVTDSDSDHSNGSESIETEICIMNLCVVVTNFLYLFPSCSSHSQ